MAFHVASVKKTKISEKEKLDFNVTVGGGIPFYLVLILLIVLPFAFIVFYSFLQKDSSNYLHLTLSNFTAFFSSRYYLMAAGRSLYFAALATVISLLLGYPVAYFIGRSNTKTRNLLVLLITVPMWINMLLRILAWKQIFEMLEKWLGINILGTDFAIIFGMVYDLLPFMIIPIYTSIMKINPQLYEAAKDLGANSAKTFFKVTVPLSSPGIISGITMVFLPAATTLVIPDKLGKGNSRYYLIGNLIESYFMKQSDPYVGSAIALILSVIILLLVFFVNKLDRSTVKDDVVFSSLKRRGKEDIADAKN